MASLSDFKVKDTPDLDFVEGKPVAVSSPTHTTTFHVSSNDDYAKVEKRPSNKKAKGELKFFFVFGQFQILNKHTPV